MAKIKGKVLLVEDSKSDQVVLKEALLRAGYAACVAENGKAAVRAMRKEHIDLVIMDYFLPDMNADEIIRASGSSVPVIIVSGIEDMKAACRLMKQGVREIIPKGGDGYPESVTATVDSVLRLRKRRNAASLVLISVSLLTALIVLIYAWNIQTKYTYERHQAEQWQQLIEDSNSAIIVCDGGGKIIQWNRGAQALLGWTEGEAVGSDLRLVIPPDRYLKHQAGINNPEIRNNLIAGEVMLIEGYVLNNQGQVLNVSIRLSAITNGHTKFVAEIIAVENIQHLPASPPPSKWEYSPPRLEKFRQAQQPSDEL